MLIDAPVKRMSMIDLSHVNLPTQITKRDGRTVPFDAARIRRALDRCFQAIQQQPHDGLDILLVRVLNILSAQLAPHTVEKTQDAVENVLLASGEFEAAKAYILYRAEHNRLRSEKPIPNEIIDAFAQAKKYFPTPLQEFQLYDKYSRWNESKGRRETWPEVVNRSVNFLAELVDTNVNQNINHPVDLWVDGTMTRIRDAIINMRAMPSMRLLAMAGPAARRNNLAIYNCSALVVNSIDAFVETLLLSMAGAGVGFSVERKHVSKLPLVEYQQSDQIPLDWVVEDSTEGWGEALRAGLVAWFSGNDVEFDFSQVRPAGTPLKIKGGRASGSDPLRNTLAFMRKRILARQGGYLRPIDAHDLMCSAGDCAVSGGIRRTALISLFDFDDMEMANCKVGDFETHNAQRWNANNSAIIPEHGISQAQFLKLWNAMVESERGEPGFVSRQAMKNTLPERRNWDANFLTNPCVTGETWVMTNVGPMRVSDLVGVQHNTVVNGTNYLTTQEGFFYTGYKPVLKITTKEGYELRLTNNHMVQVVDSKSRYFEDISWREAGSLQPGDKVKIHNHRSRTSWSSYGTFNEGWMLGELVGNGIFSSKSGVHGDILTMAHLDFWGESASSSASTAATLVRETVGARSNFIGHNKYGDRTRVSSSRLADLAAAYGIFPNQKTIGPKIEQASSDFYSGFLRGLFDADGSVMGTTNKGISIRLSQSNLERLKAVQRMLLRLGVASTIYQNRHAAGLRAMPNGRVEPQNYECAATHELVIANDNILEFANWINFSKLDKKERLETLLNSYKRTPNKESFNVVIESVLPDGIEDVFDCTVPDIHAFDANGFVAHNCAEVVLKPQQLCNLSICVARNDDTFETLADKVEIATIIGTIQSLATYFPGMRPEWATNGEKERLLGVDITGQRDCPLLEDPRVLDMLKQIAINTNIIWAKRFDINQSAAVTVVKPSGNSSVLLDCASGLHGRWAPYYERNVRVATTSPMYSVLKDAGVPLVPENGQESMQVPYTHVASFLVKSPEGTYTRNDLSALDQANYWLHVKQHWTEHNPSITVQYRPNEIIPLMSWVWEHIDMLGGMSFLPYSDVKLSKLPYIELEQSEYEQRIAEFPDIDFSRLYRYEKSDMTEAATTLACAAGGCDQ